MRARKSADGVSETLSGESLRQALIWLPPWHFTGYARVSTTDQNLSIRDTARRAVGCTVIRAEKKSGSRRDGRTELANLFEFLRPGDILVVTRIDQLTRSMKDLQDVVHKLKLRLALRA